MFIGTKFLEGGFTIIGDPYLLWDEAQINEFRETGIDVEGVANYITFTIGTPGREFPDIPDVDNFIFSGPYGIRQVKSEFKEDGSFTQTLGVYLKEDAIEFGGATTKVPANPVDGLVTPQNKIIRKIKTAAPVIPTPTLNIPQPVPTVPSVNPADISTVPLRPDPRVTRRVAELDGRGRDPVTGRLTSASDRARLDRAAERADATREARRQARAASRTPQQGDILPRSSSGAEGDEDSI